MSGSRNFLKAVNRSSRWPCFVSDAVPYLVPPACQSLIFVVNRAAGMLWPSDADTAARFDEKRVWITVMGVSR